MKENLHKKALKIATEYRKAEWQMIEVLQEIDREKLYYYYDSKSLFQYCLKHLKLSEAVAYALINISRKSEMVPELKEKIKTGEISTSKASRICSVLKPEKPDHKSHYAKPRDLSLSQSLENRQYNKKWLRKASALSSKELEKEVIKERPKDFSLKETKRQLSDEHHLLNLKLGKEEMELLERLMEVTKKKSYMEALREASDFYLEKKDPLKKKPRPQKTLRTQSKNQKKRKKIPEAIKLTLYKKQNGQCIHCATSKNLEIHHHLPVARGGTNEMENLELICSGCHKKHHFLEGSQQIEMVSRPPC